MKANKNLFIKAVLLFMVILSVKCKDKPPPDPPAPKHPKPRDILLPQILKDYFVFKVGTYWIYEDSASGKTDSVYVEKADTYNYTSPVYDSKDNYFYGNMESFSVSCRSANVGQEYTSWFSTSGAKLDSPQYDTSIYIDGYRLEALTGRSGKGFVAYYPFTLGAPYHDQNGASVFLTEKSDTFLAGKNLYYKTIKFFNSRCTLYNLAASNWTFAPNIGLVQKQAIGQKTWNLIRYHVEQ